MQNYTYLGEMKVIITLFIIILFCLIGTVFLQGKGSAFIAGFNTMSEEEKATYDIVALCKFIGKMMFALAFSMTFWLLSDLWEMQSLFWIGLGLFLSLMVFMIVFMHTKNRFRK